MPAIILFVWLRVGMSESQIKTLILQDLFNRLNEMDRLENARNF